MSSALNPLTFPLQGSHLIEASAGTGKTFTLAALYLRLVMGHGGDNGFREPLLPPEGRGPCPRAAYCVCWS